MSQVKYKTSDQDFINAVKESFSIRQTLQRLGRSATGDAYRVFHRRVKKLNLDTSHFTGQLWSKGKTLPSKRELDFYLVIDCETSISTHTLKLRLLREKVFKNECSCCGITTWQGKPAPIQLDHINGKNTDNRLENLRLLCANCHAQTDTFAGKKKRLARH